MTENARTAPAQLLHRNIEIYTANNVCLDCKQKQFSAGRARVLLSCVREWMSAVQRFFARICAARTHALAIPAGRRAVPQASTERPTDRPTGVAHRAAVARLNEIVLVKLCTRAGSPRRGLLCVVINYSIKPTWSRPSGGSPSSTPRWLGPTS